ncbi:ComEC/Rec2 family competence protein [Paraclostridium bifermentans]|uniref:ComEC/Rec2 family competence protein n=1 Tax=Paraclostridium bifermentans TaxID=1490 RepID=UPI00359C1C83
MRRPLLVVFCVVLMLSFFVTNTDKENEVVSDEFVTVSGLVSNRVEKEKYVQFDVDGCLVKDYSKKLSVRAGDVVSVKGKFKHYTSLKFEDFDYGRYLKSNGYEGVLDVKSYENVGSNLFYSKVFTFKDKISKTMNYLYKDKSEFINSILIGEKEGIDKNQKEIFSKTGVSHVLALSGLHVSILITIIGYSVGGINNFYKLILVGAILWIYSIMVGQSPSIVRAIVCSLIAYLAVFVQEKVDGISSLSFIGSILVISNPYIIYNVSFQLSFLATLSIIYFYGYINERIKFKLIALTISANILTVPLVCYHFGNISFIAVISNVVVVPFLSIIIYISILSVIILPVSLTISKIMVIINTLIIDIINRSLEFLYNLRFSFVEVEKTNVKFIIIYYIVVGIYMIYKEIKTIKEQKNGLQGYHQKYEKQRI